MNQPTKCKIVIVDDHKIFTDALNAILKEMKNFRLTSIYHTTETYLSNFRNDQPDVVLMDINFKRGSIDGIGATAITLQHNPGIKIIALSMHDDVTTVKKMFNAGACAYFTKDLGLDTLKTVLDKVCKGENYISPTAADNYTRHSMIKEESKTSSGMMKKDFTDQELAVMEYAANGKTDKEIASMLSLTKKVIEYEKFKIYKKLAVRNVAEMVQVAFRLGILT